MRAYFPSSCSIRPSKAYSLASSSLYNLPPTRSRKAFAQAAQDAPHKKANALLICLRNRTTIIMRCCPKLINAFLVAVKSDGFGFAA
ncbi:MAG: hypothetical protein MR364_02595 [Oscillospiraceae bacterium]|nr:hypothetical protein [Oscillospiraceae bacterium]